MDLSQFSLDELYQLQDQIADEIQDRLDEIEEAEEMEYDESLRVSGYKRKLDEPEMSPRIREASALFGDPDVLEYIVIVDGLSRRVNENDF